MEEFSDAGSTPAVSTKKAGLIMQSGYFYALKNVAALKLKKRDNRKIRTRIRIVICEKGRFRK